jgi:CysZ protein
MPDESRLMPDFFLALTYPFRGVAYFFRRPALWKFAAAAVAVHLLMLILFLTLYLRYRADFVADITPDRFPAWLRTAAAWILSVLIFVAGLFLSLLLGNLLTLPFLDAMTECILRDLGETLPTDGGFGRMLRRALVNQILKLIVFCAVQAGLLLLYLTPLAVLHPPVSTFVGILFLGFDYLDYPLDARRVPVPERYPWMLRRLGATLGYGTILFVVLLVPLLGYLLLPLTVAGAALLAHRLDSPPGKG